MSTAEAYSVRFLTVDSRDRDTDLYPSPSRFDVVLEEDVRDVVSIGLRAWNVPRVMPVAQGLDAVWIEDSGGSVSAARAPYAYRSEADEAGFLAALSAATPVALASGQAVAFSTAAGGGRIVARSASFFAVFSGDPSVAIWAPQPEGPPLDELPFETARRQAAEPPRFTSRRLGDGYGPGSAARALGFPRGRTPAVPDGSGGFVLVATHFHSLNSPVTSYIRVEEVKAFEASAAGITTGAGGCTAVVDETPGCNKFSTGATIVEKSFHPPLARLSRLSVSVVDYFGRCLETDNRDIRLDFTVHTFPSNAGACSAGFGINNLTKKQLYDHSVDAFPPRKIDFGFRF
jgi:hypothetical protein